MFTLTKSDDTVPNSRADAPEFTLTTCPAEPNDVNPVPPLATGIVPAFILLAFKFGILASARVPLVIVDDAKPSAIVNV